MNPRLPGVSTSTVFAFFFALLPATTLADVTINSVTATPDPVVAGFTLDVSVNVTTDDDDGDDDWQSTYIALNNGGSDIVLYCGNDPNISTNTANAIHNFTDLAVPIMASGTYTVRVRGFADNDDCDGAVTAEDDENFVETVEVTATTIELDAVLCIDASGSISGTDFQLQLDGTATGLDVALSPDSLDGTVRVTTILFSSNVEVGPGPTVIDSQGTLDAYTAALTGLSQPGGFTNTSACMSAALEVMCGGTTCPDDGIRRVVDISTDGNPTVNDCGTGGDTNSPNHQACAVQRRDELEAAGISTLNAIGVGTGIGQANMEAWVFPLPAEVFDASLGEAPGPEDEGFVILVEDFNDYEPAILAKLGAELVQGNFIVSKTYDDGTTTPVEVTLSCSGETQIGDNQAFAGPGAPAIFAVSGYDDTDTCTATETPASIPAGYTANNTNCQTVGIVSDGACTIANTQDDVTFVVNKSFQDNNTADVTISLACTGVDPADITADDNTASESDPANFTITDFPSGGTTCTATESNVPTGYTPVSTTCQDDIGLATNGECTITNNQDPVTFTVNKDFSDDNPADVTISLACTGVDPADITADDNTASESDPANFTVSNFPFAGTTCTATESNVPAGYTPVSTTCQDGIGIATNGECTVTNNQDAVTFVVSKDFDDNNPADVTISLACTGVDPADITADDNTASESDPANFTINNFPLAGTMCTATESNVPAGYTPVSTTCQDGIGIGDNGACTVTNNQDAVTFVVNKDFDDNNTANVTISLACTGVDPADITADDNTASESDPANFTVNDFPYGGTTCTATETEPAGYTAVSVTCQDGIAPNTGGECTITNVANTGTFTVRKLWEDDSQADVSVTATCTPPAIVLNNPQPAGGSGSAIFNVSRVEENTTCTATEVVPVDYEADQSDCQDNDPINGSCALVNTPLAGDPRATFRVTKHFADGNNVDEITVFIDCNTGLILDQDKLLSDGEWVEFVVTEFTEGNLACTITEDGETGYSGVYDNVSRGNIISDESCAYPADSIEIDSAHECVITNYPDPVDITVNKDWVIEGTADAIDLEFKIRLYCQASGMTGPGAYEVGYNQWRGSANGEGDETFNWQIIPLFPTSTCYAEEKYLESYVEVENGCGNLVASAGNGAGCTITNTVFFEGIPTLSQYGMAILALLMLGVGFVSFRRFS